MLRSTLLFVIGLSLAACSQTNSKEVAAASAEKAPVAEVTKAPAPAAASIEFANIPWKPSNPKAPQGVSMHLQ